MSESQARGLHPEGRPRRVRGIAAAAVVVVAVVASLVVWQPWKSPSPKLSLPAQACWGVLTGEDLRPLVGKNGTVTTETNTTTLQDTPQATNSGYRCSVYWKDGKTPLYLGDGPMVILTTADDLRGYQRIDVSSGKAQSLNFGDGNIAWEANTNVDWLNLAIPCSFQDSVAGKSYNGYARIQMDMFPNPSGPPAPTSDVRQADAAIVLKVAKAFAQQYPCTGVTLPANPPTMPPLPS
ncbi:hypothetical protein [Kitasatospora sp. LaBMicrA B282]|uniref:hypothetical protein n=1 Tax=Kitasatospora sp. LaBMicrA B282 TaxID=3420949 RepID=UPI003D0B59FC